MARVKLGLSGLSVPDTIQVCAEIVTKMTGNAAYANPVPKLSEVGDAITKLSNTYQAALNRDTVMKAEMRLAAISLHTIMVQLSAYVQTASGGVEEIILSSGMKVRKRPGPSEPLTTPINLLCLHTDEPGEAPMKCKAVKGAKMYFIQQSQTPDDPLSWKDAGSSTRVTFTAKGLKLKEDYWFRISAGGPLGNSAWSDPAKRLLS